MRRPLPLNVPVEAEGAEEIGNSQNEGVPTPQSVPVLGMTMPVCGGVEPYNEQSLRCKYCSQGVQTSSYEPAQDPMGNKISPGAQEDSGNARANTPDASKEHDNRGTFGFSRILFKRFPGTQNIRRVASSNRFETTERSHLHTSLLYAHYELSAGYH